MGKLIDNISPDNSNGEIETELKARFQDMMWKILTWLEIAFPHENGDGTDNEKSYNIIRKKVLRTGNDNIRELSVLFDSFVVLKIFEYKKQVNPNIHTDIVKFKNYKIKGEEDV